MDGRADRGSEAWENRLAEPLNFPANVRSGGFCEFERRSSGEVSVEGIAALGVCGAGMNEEQIAKRQRSIAGGKLWGIHAGRRAHPAVVTDMPACGLSGICGVIDESQALEMIAGRQRRTTVVNPASGFAEDLLFSALAFAVGQNTAAKDGGQAFGDTQCEEAKVGLSEFEAGRCGKEATLEFNGVFAGVGERGEFTNEFLAKKWGWVVSIEPAELDSHACPALPVFISKPLGLPNDSV